MKDASFDEKLNPIELFACLALKAIIVDFLGNNRSSGYQKMDNGEFPKTWCTHVSDNALSSFSSGLFP